MTILVHDLPKGSLIKIGTGRWETTITLTDDPVPSGSDRRGTDHASGSTVTVPTDGYGNPRLVLRALTVR